MEEKEKDGLKWLDAEVYINLPLNQACHVRRELSEILFGISVSSVLQLEHSNATSSTAFKSDNVVNS